MFLLLVYGRQLSRFVFREVGSFRKSLLAPFFSEIVNTPWDADVYPRMLEVIFRTNCQLACSYCQPEYSTKSAEEIRKFGRYEDDFRHVPGDDFWGGRQDNPYLEAFWKWWPEAAKRLVTFRISGGEPLLAPETFRILDDLASGEAKKFEFIINSNLSVPDKSWDSFMTKAIGILAKKKVSKLNVFGSIESFGRPGRVHSPWARL